MRKNKGLLFGVLVVCLSTIMGADKPSDPLSQLQGKWKFVDVEGGGEKRPPEHFEDSTIVIVGGEMWVSKPQGNDPKLRIILQPGKNTFDVEILEGKDKGKVVPGIYSFQDGVFRLCLNIFGNPPRRPVDFVTRSNDGTLLATLKRIKE